jgi:hypothetical protein
VTTDVAVRDFGPAPVRAEQEEAGFAALAHVLGSGDLSQLNNGERVGHYLRLCRSLGLNELSRPFDWIYFKGGEGEPEKLALYPNQSCAAQLRRQHHMRVQITRREVVGELFVCEATAYTPDGREDVASKYVPLTNRYGRLKGTMLANAMMKAETGAKRRVTLSMVGLASPPDAEEAVSWRTVIVDGVGQILPNPTAEQKALAENPSMARVVGEPVYEDAEVEDGEGVTRAARTGEREHQEHPAVPRPSFRASEEDVKRLCGAWFGAVKGTSLDDDDARHRFVLSWTHGDLEWPEGKRTESLRTMFARMTEREAGDFLAHVRAIADEERRSYLEDADAAQTDEAGDPAGAKVRASFKLTGAPIEDQANTETPEAF